MDSNRFKLGKQMKFIKKGQDNNIQDNNIQDNNIQDNNIA